jgi:aminopeptidase N
MKFFASIAVAVLFTIPAVGQSIFTLHENGEAPSRLYHVLHYKIAVAIDETHKSVRGTVTTTLTPFVNDFKTVVFDAEAMTIERCYLGSKEFHFDTDSTTLTIHLDAPYSPKDTLTLSVQYSCTPKRGMTFTGPDSAYPMRHWQFWSQGEDMTNHFWFPCHDFPNEKATSEVIVTVDKKLDVLSNGKLISVKENTKEGTKTFHWKESKPHVTYLIMVAGGEYAVLHDKVGKLPLEYYVYPEDTADARIAFQQTPDMIKFFSRMIGFPYAWEKYGQIILQDHFGGMENTSATTLTDLGTVYDARARIDDSPTSLIAHELAHQWWGDVVTCKDWRHIWLNESFASYFDPLYHEYHLGRDEFDYTMFNNQQSGITVDTTRGRKPIVSVESYGENIYPRGSAVLHMLRFILGDSLFWKSINHYITKYQFQPVETNDFKNAIEEATGQNLYWFFDEWVYKAGHPIFDVSYIWNDSSKTISLSVKQTQTIDSLTPVFKMPVDVEITTPGHTTTYRLSILTKDTVYTLPADVRPLLVVFDKGNWILKEVKFEKTREEWNYQAEHAPHIISRIRALQAIGKLPENSVFLPLMIRAMQHDSFWAVRREAINQSEKLDLKTDSLKILLKQALLTTGKDNKSAVRAAAVTRLGSFHGKDVLDFLMTSLEDSSYNVIQNTLRSIAKLDSANALPVLKKYLDYPSHRNRVATSALSSIALVDTNEALSLAQTYGRYGAPIETRYTALGLMNKYGKNRSETLPFLQSLLADNNAGIRSYAARLLGDVGDEKTIELLQPLAGDKYNFGREAAKSSIEKIKKRLSEKSEKISPGKSK